MLVTSCLAFVHPAGSYGCLTWFKVPDEHGRRPPGPLSGMGGSDVRQRVDRAQSASRSAFDPYTAKLLRPLVRPGTVSRPDLVERLVNHDARPIVSMVAPAGYGKTTLLSQWAEHSTQAVAGCRLTKRTMTRRSCSPTSPKPSMRSSRSASGCSTHWPPRRARCLARSSRGWGRHSASMTSPVTLVLDDVHLLHNSECRAALSVLADHVPERVTAGAGRAGRAAAADRAAARRGAAPGDRAR